MLANDQIFVASAGILCECRREEGYVAISVADQIRDFGSQWKRFRPNDHEDSIAISEWESKLNFKRRMFGFPFRFTETVVETGGSLDINLSLTYHSRWAIIL